MSSQSRPGRLAPIAALGALVALVAGYLNDCFAGVGLSPGGTQPAAPVVEKVEPAPKAEEPGGGKLRVVVQGEQCRVGEAAEGRSCEAVCAEQAAGATVEVEATAGAQRTVEALRACLQGRGVKVQVLAE